MPSNKCIGNPSILQLNILNASAVARLHIEGIGTGFISSLGVGFVTALYEVIDEDTGSSELR